MSEKKRNRQRQSKLGKTKQFSALSFKAGSDNVIDAHFVISLQWI